MEELVSLPDRRIRIVIHPAAANGAQLLQLTRLQSTNFNRFYLFIIISFSPLLFILLPVERTAIVMAVGSGRLPAISTFPYLSFQKGIYSISTSIDNPRKNRQRIPTSRPDIRANFL